MYFTGFSDHCDFINHIVSNTHSVSYIGGKRPYIEPYTIYNRLAGPMKFYKLPHIKELLEAYFSSRDDYYKKKKWNIMFFLKQETLNVLEQ